MKTIKEQEIGRTDKQRETSQKAKDTSFRRIILLNVVREAKRHKAEKNQQQFEKAHV